MCLGPSPPAACFFSFYQVLLCSHFARIVFAGFCTPMCFQLLAPIVVIVFSTPCFISFPVHQRQSALVSRGVGRFVPPVRTGWPLTPRINRTESETIIRCPMNFDRCSIGRGEFKVDLRVGAPRCLWLRARTNTQTEFVFCVSGCRAING